MVIGISAIVPIVVKTITGRRVRDWRCTIVRTKWTGSVIVQLRAGNIQQYSRGGRIDQSYSDEIILSNVAIHCAIPPLRLDPDVEISGVGGGYGEILGKGRI